MSNTIQGVILQDRAKVLSVKHPWAWLIFNGQPVKDVENRDWRTSYRGNLWIHASKGLTQQEYDEARRFLEQRKLNIKLPSLQSLKRTAGHVIGKVILANCVSSSSSPWFVGDYGFVLKSPQLLTTPFPHRGFLGLWDFPEETLETQVFQLAEPAYSILSTA